MTKTDLTARKRIPGCPSCNGTALKVLAVLLMCVDHAGAVLFPGAFAVEIGGYTYSFLRLIGRISFPIFAFLLAEGAVYTSNWRRYALRLAVLFLISEPVYDRLFYGTFFYPGNQNIMLTLLVGLLAIRADLHLNRTRPGAEGMTLGLLAAAAACMAAEYLGADYGLHGVLLMYLLYRTRKSVWQQLLALFVVNVVLYGGLQSFAVLAWIPLACYDGTPGTKNRLLRDGFYLFYPLHLLALLGIAAFV